MRQASSTSGSKTRAFALLVGTFALLSAPFSFATLISTGVIIGSAQNISQISPAGGSTAGNISFGSFVVESFASNTFVRPIMLFDKSVFSGFDTSSLTAASLSLTIIPTSFGEAGDVYTSPLRMFSTSLDLNSANRNTFAALTGDAGSFSTIDSLTVVGNASGNRTINFDAVDLAALSSLLMSPDTRIGFSFREDAYVANGGGLQLDGFAFSPTTVSLSIDGTLATVSEPISLSLFGLGVAGLGLSRRKKA